MEIKKLKTVFIGCGQYATENIYPALRYCPIELLATCALHIENAKRNAQWFNAPHYYDDYRKMLDNEKPDAAIIVVSALHHAEMACEALKRDVHVFMAKPPSVDLEGTERIIAQAQKSQKVAMVDFQKRYAPAYAKAKEIIEARSFGAPKHIQTKLCTGRMISGGDFILEIGIHHLDLVRFFFGEVDALSVKACCDSTGEAYAINLKFKNGAVGSMILSEQQSWLQHSERVEITGSGNFIEIDNVCKLAYFNKGLDIAGIPVSYLLGKKQGKVVWEPNFSCLTMENSLLYQSGIIEGLRHFCDCVLNRKVPMTSIEDAYKTMLLVFQAKKARC